MIRLDNVTSLYSNGKGVRDISFAVPRGSVVGYLGSNGAGKTTTIRTLLGFIKVDSGTASIGGLDCFECASTIMGNVGYLPGEISFAKGMTGRGMLDYVCGMRGGVDRKYMQQLIDILQLDIRGEISKYSKGMKQKLAIVIALMHDPDVLILDEPTSGLDPLMQGVVVQLILQLRARGKTILMSSHIFEEIERTCDKVVVIRDGAIVAQASVAELKSHQMQAYKVQSPDRDTIAQWGYDCIADNTDATAIEVRVKVDMVDAFVKQLATVQIDNIDSVPQTLEQIFLGFYGKEAHHE